MPKAVKTPGSPFYQGGVIYAYIGVNDWRVMHICLRVNDWGDKYA